MRPERITCDFLRSAQAKGDGAYRPVVGCLQPDLVTKEENINKVLQINHIPFKRKLLIFDCQTTTLSEITAGTLKGQ